MENFNNTNDVKRIYYNHQNIDDKHFFGGFLNLALNNIELIVEEFRSRLHLPKAKTEIEILNNFFSKPNLSYTDWDRGINVLKEYLPIIEFLDLPITDKQFDGISLENKEKSKRDYFRKNFTLLIKSIEDLRNFYTHFYHPRLVLDENLFMILDSTLLKVSVEVKKNKMKQDKTKQTLKKRLKSEFEILVELEKKYQKEKGIKSWNISENIEGAIYNNAFSNFIIKDKNNSIVLSNFNKSKYFSKNDNSDEPLIDLSISGLVFLLSMFLSKKENEHLKANIAGFKGKIYGETDLHLIDRRNNSLRNMATHWVFSHLTFRGLKQRVKNTFEKETLLMQMVDELNKVPNEIYFNLTKNDQDKFIEDINEYIKDNQENNSSLQESTVVHPVIRKRYEDKFNYFALRFLDEYANFPTLRFKVYVGNYMHDNRTKIIPGGLIESERMIKEKLNVFEKLSLVSKNKSEFFKDEKNETQWELFPNPSFSFNGNNIQIHINLFKYEEAKDVQKEINVLKSQVNINIERRNDKPSKKDILKEIFGKDIVTGNGTAVLSLNELPSLLYELLVLNKTGEELEKIIVEKIVNHYNEIKNYDISTSLSNNYIPKKMKRSQNETILNTNKIKNDIENEINITNEKLNIINLNTKEFNLKDKKLKRKHIFYSNEIGIEATWLAYDLKRFMPKESKKLWKGNYHSELQRYIAFYDRNKKDALAILSEFWDFEKDTFFGEEIQIAFLKKDFVSFYSTYLLQRKKVLERLLSFVQSFENEPKVLKKGMKDFYRIFDERLYYIKPLKFQKEQILTKPINLPRGIFDDKPTFIADKNIANNQNLYADWHVFSLNTNHNYQNFYDIQLNYQVNFEKNRTEAKDFNDFVRKQNLKIKSVKIRDLFAKLMVDSLFKNIFQKEFPFDLKKLYQDGEERRANILLANSQKDREKGDISENVMNTNFIWNETTTVDLFGGRILEPKVKIKEIGKFKKFETDKKIKILLDYNPTKVWSKLEVENEMENLSNSYERIRREKILKTIQDFEKFILEKHNVSQNHIIDFEYNGNPNFKKYISNGVLRKIDNLSEIEIHFIENKINYTLEDTIDFETIRNLNPIIIQGFLLILIRNKFAHNELPSVQTFSLMQEFLLKSNESSYADYFHNVILLIIKNLKEHIN